MTQSRSISSIEIDNRPSEPNQDINDVPFDELKISCAKVRYERCIPVLVCIILIPIVITVPVVLINKGTIKTNTVTTTQVPMYSMVTNTTKWKQSGTTIYRQSDVDEFDVGLNPIYIDDDDDNETIYIAETTKNRVIAFQSHATNFKVVAGGNGIGDGTHQIFQPTDIVIDKKTNSMLICDSGNTRIVRWSRQNARDGRIVISNVYCNGLAMDDKGYLYVSDWLKYEVKRWDIGTTNTNTIVAGGNGGGNGLGQLQLPGLIFVDRDYSVYVVDTSNHRLMKWMKGAKKGLVVAGGNDNGTTLKHLSSPLGMIVDHLGNIYVSDTKNNRVMRWINGATEGSIVVGGNGEGNQKNQLNRPTDLSFDKHGNLYVFDSVNQRLQKFDIESN